MKVRYKGKQMTSHQKEECLLVGVNSVFESEHLSFDTQNLAWEASTLPLSYTR